ncbi:hypothetical protein FJ471_09240 [Mesorhizobium sp. B2-7-1]|nr:hypothetical protein FJ471_09240 [Mesorhizobium sp. B2-7-1]
MNSKTRLSQLSERNESEIRELATGILNPVRRRKEMGRGILLWLLGVPIPIIILLMLFAR